jgi:hypothetical protein
MRAINEEIIVWNTQYENYDNARQYHNFDFSFHDIPLISLCQEVLL